MVLRNAVWIKDIEAVARGSSSIRNYEVESAAYDIDEFPTTFTFRAVGDVSAILACIAAMSDDEKDERMRRSVEDMR